MRQTALRPEFVEFIPEQLEDGVLYISHRYGTALHLCCCGCCSEVVKPTNALLINDFPLQRSTSRCIRK
jgi:hypothetical protein